MKTRRVVVPSILVILLASWVGWGSEDLEPAEPSVPKNIILIGWDGAQRAHVVECFLRNELPNLRQLSLEGAWVEIDIEGTTDTKAGWAQILTGYYPQVTGVYGNGRFRPIPKGLTVFERLERHFGSNEFVTVAVIGKKGHVGCAAPKKVKMPAKASGSDPVAPAAARGADNADRPADPPPLPRRKQPTGSRIVEEDGVMYRVTPGEPYFLSKKGMDVFENGLSLNETVGTRAIELLEAYKDRPFFFFVHFAEPDHAGHKHGENSTEYNDGLISDDLWTGRIIEKLRALGLYDRTLVYVTADHGFDEGLQGHRNAPYVFLATNDGDVIRGGLRQDVAATILGRFGLDVAALKPPLDGTPLTAPGRRDRFLGSERTTEPRREDRPRVPPAGGGL